MNGKYRELPECIGMTQPPLRGQEDLHEEGFSLSPPRAEFEAGTCF